MSNKYSKTSSKDVSYRRQRSHSRSRSRDRHSRRRDSNDWPNESSMSPNEAKTDLKKENERLKSDKTRLEFDLNGLRDEKTLLAKRLQSLEQSMTKVNEDMVTKDSLLLDMNLEMTKKEEVLTTVKKESNHLAGLLDKEQETRKRLERDLNLAKFSNKDLSERLAEESKQNVILVDNVKKYETKIQSLVDKNTAFVSHEIRYKDNEEKWSQRCLYLKEKSHEKEKQMINDFNKEKIQMKANFRAELCALKKQRQYFMRSNETNKRKQMSAEYLYERHKTLFKANPKDILASVESNTHKGRDQLKEELSALIDKKFDSLDENNSKDIANVVITNRQTSEQLVKNCEVIKERTEDDEWKCPECEGLFKGKPSLDKHMKAKHYKTDPRRLIGQSGGRVIATIDLSDNE